MGLMSAIVLTYPGCENNFPPRSLIFFPLGEKFFLGGLGGEATQEIFSFLATGFEIFLQNYDTF